MLADLGYGSIDELFVDVPAGLKLSGRLDIEPAMSEPDLLARLLDLGSKNRARAGEVVSFAGAGAYDHEVPAVVRSLASRSEFVTAYTPYQPEVAQGVLQAIFEYQTMVARLAGLEVANGSLYDGAAALVEGVNLSVAATKCKRVLCSKGVPPSWRAVLKTFAAGTGHEVELVEVTGGVTDWESSSAGGGRKAELGAVVVAAPNYLGYLEDVARAREVADRTGARLVVCADPVAAGLLRTPGSLGADVVVGEGQVFGTSLGFGGPYLGLFACRLADVRRLPGRLVGETVDSEGRRAYVTTLRAREQDIRREKASSNVCTNQTLMAVTAAIHLAWLGPRGLREVAIRSGRATRYLAEALFSIDGVEPCAKAPFLRELALRTPVESPVLIDRLLEEGYLAGVHVSEGFEGTPYDGALLMAATERRTRAEIDGFAAALAKAVR